MLSNHHLHEICLLYHFTMPILEIRKVPGGCLHELWYLRTKQGEYAIKRLNESASNLLRNNLQLPEKSEKIAQTMHLLGIPTAVALQQNGYFVSQIAGAYYIVMPWIQGDVFSPLQTNENMVYLIGMLLGRIHKLNLKTDNQQPTRWQCSNINLNQLLTLLPAKTDLVRRLIAEYKDFIEWNQNEVISNDNSNLIFSHCDLDQKNVIWQCDLPIVLDWEYSGLIDQSLDIFIVAMNWCDVITGHINVEKLQAFLKGYRAILRDLLSFSPKIIPAYIAYCLDWVNYNLQHPNDFSEHEITQSLTAIYAVLKSKHRFKALFSSC